MLITNNLLYKNHWGCALSSNLTGRRILSAVASDNGGGDSVWATTCLDFAVTSLIKRHQIKQNLVCTCILKVQTRGQMVANLYQKDPALDVC